MGDTGAADAQLQDDKSSSPASLEVVFASALAGIASLLKDPGQRAIATSLAPPIGYVTVKLGRKLVDDWIPKWVTPKIPPPETPESRARSFIEEAKKELHSGTLSPEQARRKAQHIIKLEEALNQKLLDDLQAVPSASLPDTSTKKDDTKESPDSLDVA